MAPPVKSDPDVLPDVVKPINYRLLLHDLQLGGDWTYQGNVSIEAEIKQATKEITLNALLLNIHSAQISSSTGKTPISSSDISYDAARQRVTITFPETIQPSKLVIIDVRFQGIMNSDMAGFSRAKYKPAIIPTAAPQENGDHYMFSTQFESCDARRAFPCMDEPNLKATFDFSIEIPGDLVALSNMPEKDVDEELAKTAKEGRKIVAFDRSPIMSTYLLAWVSFLDLESFRKWI